MEIRIKRVYEDADKADGFRILVDRLWPRGVKKESLRYNLWAKDIAPSAELRKWFHVDTKSRWKTFALSYKKELSESNALKKFVEEIKDYPVITLLYASKDKEHNHALILKEFLYNFMKE